MAPGVVRTVPPWVIQRPPQSLLPQHNHAPTDPRHGRGGSGSSPGEVGSSFGSAVGDSNGAGLEIGGTGTAGVATTVDGAPDTAAIGKEESPERGLGQRISLLFRTKEGRKWDHLRSAEPVIVSQFHVVTGPITADGDAGGDYFGKKRRSGHGKGRREGADGIAEEPATAAAAAAATTSARHYGADATVTATASTSATDTASGLSPHTVPAPHKPSSSATHARHPWWYNPETQWRGFIESSRYPHPPNEKSEIVDDEEMARLHPDFGYNSVLGPKVGGGEGGGGVGHFHQPHHRPSHLLDKAFYQRIWHALLHHPLGPLACRLTVLTTSIVALALAITIFRREQLGSIGDLGSGDRSSDNINSVWLADMQQERTQVIVAIVVDVVAIPYIGYITVDDYTGKPLGLRPPTARIRLILTDLFFIIFKSASTALGFEAMIFFTTDTSQGLLRALGAFELIGLVSWALTLTINIFREIARLGG